MQNESGFERTSELIYELRDVNKIWDAEGVAFHLHVPELQIVKGEKIALIGVSGCGKSTLLDILAFISRPSFYGFFQFCPSTNPGPIEIVEQWQQRRFTALSNLRKKYIGYVMQTGGLLPFLSVRDNINLSRQLLNLPEDGTVETVAQQLGVDRHLNKFPSALSTGERQRVAIGRALAHKPAIVIADEPTASLDPSAADRVMNLFMELVEELNITVIVASHALRHIEALGLRCLTHWTQYSEDGRITETVVKG